LSQKLDGLLKSAALFIVRHWLLLINTAVLVFIIPIVLYPIFMATGDPGLQYVAGGIKAAYHLVCHQLPRRSLFIFGYQMAVDARSFAIYVSFLAVGLIFPLIRDRLKPWKLRYYILLMLPMAIDGFTQLFGVPIPRGIGPEWHLIWTVESTNVLRVITGTIFGLASALFIFPILQGIMSMEGEDLKRSASSNGVHATETNKT
jgi:uncharacterized membrane protein